MAAFELKRQGGLYQTQPVLAVLFLIPAMSLAGMPPLSGFFAKLSLVRAGLGAGRYAIAAVALAVGLLTLFSMTKIWAEAFWKEFPQTEKTDEPRRQLAPMNLSLLVAPIAIMALILVAIGIGAESVFSLATRAGEQLMDPHEYIQVVLGARQ